MVSMLNMPTPTTSTIVAYQHGVFKHLGHKSQYILTLTMHSHGWCGFGGASIFPRSAAECFFHVVWRVGKDCDQNASIGRTAMSNVERVWRVTPCCEMF